MSYRSIDKLQRVHAKMTRITETKQIVDTIGDDELRAADISDRTDIPTHKLKEGFLGELTDYGILEQANKGGGPDNKSTWTVHKPSNIESLKADMMGATA